MVSRQGVPIFRVDVVCPLTGGEGETYSSCLECINVGTDFGMKVSHLHDIFSTSWQIFIKLEGNISGTSFRAD